MKNISIFDLDETVINSAHRTPNNPDGTLNLEGYRKNHTSENVARDTLLPLAKVMRAAYRAGHYVIVLTARDMKECDYKFLREHNLQYHKIMSRDTVRSKKHYFAGDAEYKAKWIVPFLNLRQFRDATIVMFDDAKPVKALLRKYFPVICSHKVNARVA